MTASLRVVTEPRVAADVLLAGGLAVLPTETVYGLGARADDPHAVARVYAAKGRPADHPLIVHVASAGALAAWSVDVPPYATDLAEALWPGPLTLVLPRSSRAGHHVTGGQETVGLRVPAHPVTLEVLAAMDAADPAGAPHGVAAPSANRFGRVSPTTAAHAVAELSSALDPGRDVVVEGGPCAVGVESTILDCTGAAPVLLRPGGITAADVERVAGVDVSTRASSVRAPGTLASHYAPRARVRLVPADDPALGRAAERAGPADDAAGLIGLLALAEVATPQGLVRLSAPADAAEYARVLYAALREADALGLAEVLAVPPPGPGISAAVADRLTRAATR